MSLRKTSRSMSAERELTLVKYLQTTGDLQHPRTKQSEYDAQLSAPNSYAIFFKYKFTTY